MRETKGLSVHDDLGNIVPYHAPRKIDVILSPNELAMLAKLKDQHPRWWWVPAIRRKVLPVMALGILTCIGTAWLDTILLRYGLVRLFWATTVASVIVFSPMFAYVGPMIARADLDRDKRRLCSLGRCGACGQDLRGSPPRDDDYTICSECGAAWKLDQHHNSRENRGSLRRVSNNAPI